MTSLGLMRTQLEIFLWRNGWAWLLVLLLAACAASLELLVVRPGQRALEDGRRELAQLKLSADKTRSAQLAGPLSEQERLQRVRTVLQQTPDVGEVVRKMNGLAQAEQISLVQSDYQAEFNSTLQARRVQINQPVRASYLQLRRYIEAVLRAVPGASLDQITARRQDVGQGQVEARLKWSIWVLSPSSSAASPAQSKP